MRIYCWKNKHLSALTLRLCAGMSRKGAILANERRTPHISDHHMRNQSFFVMKPTLLGYLHSDLWSCGWKSLLLSSIDIVTLISFEFTQPCNTIQTSKYQTLIKGGNPTSINDEYRDVLALFDLEWKDLSVAFLLTFYPNNFQISHDNLTFLLLGKYKNSLEQSTMISC